MLIKELPALAGEATTLVWAGDDSRAEELLAGLLNGQDGIRRLPYDPDGTDAFDTDTLVVAFAGPDLAADQLAATLRRLAPGGRVVLLLGWPVDELPYHVLLDPLVEAGCQVLQAVPVDRANRHGVHCAVVAARVERLAPLRSYLDDSPITLGGAEPELRTLLRLTGEHLFGDLVARPLRRQLADLRDRVDTQQKRIRELEAAVRTADAKVAGLEERHTAVQEKLATTRAKLATAQERLTQLRSSTTFQVGYTIVEGARRPARALVSVPTGLVRAWRNRG
ncbi:hypothetical protein OHA21_35160 [Actinoplanes sp. NBC_00393]|uniref:hypothetical protein n=1 Tax=Actinoplanes sp. NBC_00393 TaxID=2975953 RepID=UPI002E204BC0